jgi:hypothetical protein
MPKSFVVYFIIFFKSWQFKSSTFSSGKCNIHEFFMNFKTSTDYHLTRRKSLEDWEDWRVDLPYGAVHKGRLVGFLWGPPPPTMKTFLLVCLLSDE